MSRKKRARKKDFGYELNILDPIETTTGKGRSFLQDFRI
jgi:hypothetical protein